MAEQTFHARYGSTALVTGASSGIGEHFARELAAQGFDLLLSARRESLLQALADELQHTFDVEVQWRVCDLSVDEDVDGLLAWALEKAPQLIVSNAGYGVAKGELLSIPTPELDAMYQANSIAPARLIRTLLPGLVERGRGGIICTGSMEGDAPFPYSVAYAASKAFLHSFMLGLWYELRGTGVDVLLLAPGSTDTQAPVSQGISRDQLVGIMAPGDVARQALAQLGRGPQFIPGLHNRLFVALLRRLPRKWALTLAGQGMRRAIENSRV